MTPQSYAPAVGGLGQDPWRDGASRDWLVRAHARADRRPYGTLATGCVFGLWYRRAVERRRLLSLDDAILLDIGVSREAMLREARKPFWRA